MSLRQDWKFDFPATTVLEAAQHLVNHHQSRLAFWDGERHGAEKKLREEGVTFRDSPVTGGMRVDAVLDPQLQARVNECTAKTREHLDARESYERWVRTLKAAPEGTLSLDMQDIAYFGL